MPNINGEVYKRPLIGLSRPVNIIGMLWCLFVIFMPAMMLRSYARDKYLLRWGTVVPAKIIGEREYRGPHNAKFSAVTYSFTDRDGNTVEGTRKAVARQADIRPGFAEIRARIFANPTVLYDPRNSRRNTLYPPSAAEMAD